MIDLDEIRPTRNPRRVLVSRDGTAVSADEARRDFNIESDVVFVRGDGWMLGAPGDLANHAHDMWWDQWVAYYRPPDTRVWPIADFDDAA